jgi:hypothetical protein
MTCPTVEQAYTRNAAALVRYGPYAGQHAGKPRFSYDPRRAPVNFLDHLLTPDEAAVITDARNVLGMEMPAGSNVNDIRLVLPDTLAGKARVILARLQSTFPHPDDVPGAYPHP